MRKTTKTATAAPTNTIKLEAARVYSKDMSQKFKSEAMAWAIIDERNETITYANTYREGKLPASYSPTHYTYQYKGEKTLAKLEKGNWAEVGPDEWPDFIEHVVPPTAGTEKVIKRSRKVKGASHV